jgi:uncharacterized repeat protein (TIGR01451 family)
LWKVDTLPVGNYTAIFDTSGHYIPTCPVMQNFTIVNSNETTFGPNMGLETTIQCTNPDISVIMPRIRPCVQGQSLYISACNNYYATATLINAYVVLELDTSIIPVSSNYPFTPIGSNMYRFDLGNINIGECTSINVSCNVSCDLLPRSTVCIKANLYPADTCALDTIPLPLQQNISECTQPWDRSSLTVDGWCQNDSIIFVIKNNGIPTSGDMVCWSPVRIYIDGIYTILDSVLLAGGDSIIFAFSGEGRTWRLETEQHPLHPGNSHPNATVELCGNLQNWTPNLVNILPHDDADPIVDIFCGIVINSHDPNDKTGFPMGISNNHLIKPDQQIQYLIRFQNTGNDTAFTVIIRDTLDIDLDIFSVVTGVSSNNYSFRMYGPRILEWKFENILLPDSCIIFCKPYTRTTQWHCYSEQSRYLF